MNAAGQGWTSQQHDHNMQLSQGAAVEGQDNPGRQRAALQRAALAGKCIPNKQRAVITRRCGEGQVTQERWHAALAMCRP